MSTAGIAGIGPVNIASMENAETVTAQAGDLVVIQDISDSNKLKTATVADVGAGGSGAELKADGSVALTDNWDAGSYKITAETLESDVATGTAPLTVASTTVVSNLNADKVDGYNLDQSVSINSSPTFEVVTANIINGIAATDGQALGLTDGADKGIFILCGGGVVISDIKSGATQVAAGAVAGEIWKTASHATLPDNVLLIGV